MKRLSTLLIFAALMLLGACNSDGVITAQPEPVITLDSPDGIYTVKVGRAVTITPAVENGEDAAYEWSIDGTVVGTDRTYTFTSEKAGTYYVLLSVTNRTGSDRVEMRIEVLELQPPVISFPEAVDGVITVAAGTEHTITPSVANGEQARYEWRLDGESVGSEPTYTFLGDAAADHRLTLTPRTRTAATKPP